MVVAVSAGFILEKLGFEKYVRPEAYESTDSGSSCGTSCGDSVPEVQVSCCSSTGEAAATIVPSAEPSRWVRIWINTWKDFKQVLPYLLMGIALGSLIYGFIPTDLIAEYAGAGNWYAIPVAAVIGIPLYIRAEAVIPLSAALVQKGMALGSVMALIIGSAGASLTEVILLKSIFKNQMIAAFLFVILSMAVGAGYLYTFLFA